MQAAAVKDRKIEQLCAQLRKCQEAGVEALEATGLDTTAFEETQATGEHTPQDTMVCAALSKLQIGYLAQKQRGEVLQNIQLEHIEDKQVWLCRALSCVCLTARLGHHGQ